MSENRHLEIQSLVKNLNLLLSQGNQDKEKVNDVIIDISELLSAPLSSLELAVCVSCLLGSEGLIDFCTAVANDIYLCDAKKSALEVFKLLLERDIPSFTKYSKEVQELCRLLYNADKSAKVKVAALDLLGTLLISCGQKIEFGDFNVPNFVKRLVIEIKGKGSLLQFQLAKTLGILAYVLPDKVKKEATLTYKVLKEQLIAKTKPGNQQDLTAAAGAIRGLTFYFHNFPQGCNDDPKLYSELYPYLHKLLDPGLNLPKREIQRAALELLHKHGAKFSVDLLSRYQTVFAWLITWCKSNNRDDHKAALPAMDTFVTVIANVLELQAEEEPDKSSQVLKVLLDEYNKILETSTSTSQISLAIKGYGLLAGTCKIILPQDSVVIMFTRILTCSQQSFFQSSDMLENKVMNLPSYIESLAFIITNIDHVNNPMVENVIQLSLALAENFPYVSQFKRFLVYRALLTLFAALRGNNDHYKSFLHNFVYQFILHTCSHLPVIEAESAVGSDQLSQETSSISNNKWNSATGLKGEVISYCSYLPLWMALTTPEKLSNFKISGHPVTVLTQISCDIYYEFLDCIIEITEKLNLETSKIHASAEEGSSSSEQPEELASLDPLSGLQAKTPKDFQVYINLEALIEEVIPSQNKNLLNDRLVNLLWYFIRKSSLEPYVSTHYAIIKDLLKASKQSEFFKNQDAVDTKTTIHVLSGYIKEVLERCKQFRNQLLASCLTLILQLPLCIVSSIFPHLVAPLQMSLELGLSYHPIANVCLLALHSWLGSLPKEMIKLYFPQIIPQLLPYLRSQESLVEGELQTRVISVKMALAKNRRKVDKKKFKEGKKVYVSSMRKLQLSILQLLGNMDQDLCFCIVPNQDECVAQNALAWDIEKMVKFSVPFQEIKLDIFLDELLPNTVDKALNSSDRQTKIAACELLHSLIILMIGTGRQMSDETQQRSPMAALYRHLFKVMLKLSCDSDNVTRQLFLTLTYQSIHWFTNNRQFENPDTAVLLQCIMDGIIAQNDSALRDLCSQCLTEFLKWSRKQSRRIDQFQNNLKSVFKRIIGYCKHPSAFKRLGGCLAWNSIYQEVREDERSCDVWMVEILCALMACLKLCQEDDPLLGTQTLCQTVIKHVSKIIIKRKDLFNKFSGARRVPEELNKGTLTDIIEWLLPKIGSSDTILRHSSMELLLVLVPHTKGYNSVQNFITKKVKDLGLVYLLNIIEKEVESHQMTLSQISTNEFRFKDLTLYLKSLLAALDCYTWIISRGIASSQNLIANKDVNILNEISFFLNNVARVKADVILRNEVNVEYVSSSKTEKLDELRCTVIVRLMDFTQEILSDGKHCNLYIEEDNFFDLVIACTLNPSSVGFNFKDTEVTQELPLRIGSFLTTLNRKLTSVYSQKLHTVIRKEVEESLSCLKKNLPVALSSHDFIPLENQHLVQGIIIFYESKYIQNTDMIGLPTTLLNCIESSLLKSDNGTFVAQEIPNKHLPFIEKCLTLAILLDKKSIRRLLNLVTNRDCLTNEDGKSITKGSHALNILGDITMKLLIKNTSECMNHALQIESTHILESLQFLSKLLSTIMRNAELRRASSRVVLTNLFSIWKTLNTRCENSIAAKDSLLGLLITAILIDREGTLKKELLDRTQGSIAVLDFFKSYMLDGSLSLASKIKALKILPFFLIDEIIHIVVKEILLPFRQIHLPLHSREFGVESSREKEFKSVIQQLLIALELSGSLPYLEFIIKLFGREECHLLEENLQSTLEPMIRSMSITKQCETLTFLFKMFNDESIDKNMRLNIVEKILVPTLHHSNDSSVVQFYTTSILTIMNNLSLVIGGRSDEQHKKLVSKTGSFFLLQVLYTSVPREKLFAPGSEINKVFQPSDASGKELTKEIFKRTIRTAKGELRHVQTHFPLRRKCSCAAYNTLIAVLSNVQDQLKFYVNFLFTEAPSKDEAIFESLIDCDKKFEFDIEVGFNLARKNRFVTVRKSKPDHSLATQEGFTSGTVKYMASHYLSDSSLRDDLSQYDFSNSIVLSQSGDDHRRTRSYSSDVDDRGHRAVRLDPSDFNDHEVMPNLTAVIQHMVEAKIMTIYEGEEPPSANEVPQWMDFLKQKIIGPSNQNVKLFILRLIINTENVFQPYANHFISPIISVIVDGSLGKSINYFIADLLVVALGWGDRAIPEDNPEGRSLVSRLLHFLCLSVPHVRADVFKYNLNIVKTVVEKWKSLLTVPQDILFRLLQTKNGTLRENEAALQICGVLLSNNLLPYLAHDAGAKERFKIMIFSLLNDKASAVYSPAAEVLGLMLLVTTANEDEELMSECSKKLVEILMKQEGQGITCIFYVQKHFPAINSKLINRLLSLLPRVYGIHRERILQCLVSCSKDLENIFSHMKEQKIIDNLVRKEARTQLVSLQLVNNVLPRMEPKQIQFFVGGVSSFEFHSAPMCRELMYEIFIWIYDNYGNQTDEEGISLFKESQLRLLRGTKDEDAALRQSVMNFWSQRAKQLNIAQRLLFILDKIYNPDGEETFLVLATYLLLEATHSAADFTRPIFPQPLTECIFREMRVRASWKARHASMVPLFADTQTNSESSLNLISLTQSMDEIDHCNPRVQATQQYLFSATMAQGDASFKDTYNWVTGATLDMSNVDLEINATLDPSQKSSTGLIYSRSTDMNQFKRTGLGHSRMKPEDKDGASSKQNTESQLMRRRFVTNQDRAKQTVYFARQEERKRKMRNQVETERNLRREAQVTLFRQYRVGELPDVQIPHKAIIAPLQALVEKDERTASHVFQLLCDSIMSDASSLMSPTEEKVWKTEVYEAIRNILHLSHFYNTSVIRPLLHLVISNDIPIRPDIVSTACMGSGLEPLGILALERKVLLLNQKSKDAKPPPKKKQKQSPIDADVNLDVTDLWLNIADMFKNLSLWDSVLGILKIGIGNMKDETRQALEAESQSNYFEAYKYYRYALTADWMEQPSVQERQIWEEWFVSSAEVLGQWDEIDKLIHTNIFNSDATNMNKIWDNSRHTSVFLGPLVNSKLMKILHGSNDDGGLCKFIDDSRSNPRSRSILEGEMSLQLAILAINQEQFEEAESCLSLAHASLLNRIAQCSLLSCKPIFEQLKDVQALSEMKDFFDLLKTGNSDAIDQNLHKWIDRKTLLKEHLVQSQYVSSFRDLYLHFLTPKVNNRRIIEATRAASHIAVVEAAIANSNPHLAHRHLLKLETVPKIEPYQTQFYFLKVEASILRANQKTSFGKIRYLVEAWTKYMTEIETSSKLSKEIETKYLILESSLCLQICESIREWSDWDPNNNCIRTLARKFPSVIHEHKDSWYKALLECSDKGLAKTLNLLERQETQLTKDVSYFFTLSTFYENCLEHWSAYLMPINYIKGLMKTVLQGMVMGSKDSHFRFPRLIHLIEKHPELISTFVTYCERVPTWMFILWLTHLLIYVDKIPGPAVQPIIVRLAEEYPQAVVYPYEAVKNSISGEDAFCLKIQEALNAVPLAYDFITAISLVHLPHIQVRDKIKPLFNIKSKSDVANALKNCYDNFFKQCNAPKHSPSEKGSIHLESDPLMKEAIEVFRKKCGSEGNNLSSLNVTTLHSVCKSISSILEINTTKMNKISKKLISYSPWLANFSSSNYKDQLEIPGQYIGLSKPIPTYHTKIGSFNENVSIMASIRLPIKIVINGDDENEYAFLVKSGEDLRTDQRMESLFSLLNCLYESNSACSKLSTKPRLTTYQVVPLSQKTGLLQWVNRTQTLMDFMTDNLQEAEKRSLNNAIRLFGDAEMFQVSKSKVLRDKCVQSFENCVNYLPWDLLRRKLFMLSANHESFFYLRNSFVSSYSTLCISHWLLGIGDRHLGNCLMSLNSGRVVGIDFGHHFESATQFLPIPELIPFRLTTQIVNVMQPLGINGPMRETMIACLTALRDSRLVIFAAVEAFVKEPTEDWLQFVSKQEGSSDDPQKVKLFSIDRMNDLIKKLSGTNPSAITSAIVSKNKFILKAKKVEDYQLITTGKSYSKRSQLKEDQLSVTDQVDILIEMATDPNILGRTYIGWKPFL